jgi:hypothetical protein
MDLIDSAAMPLVTSTAVQLVRLATRAYTGQTILVSGALAASDVPRVLGPDRFNGHAIRGGHSSSAIRFADWTSIGNSHGTSNAPSNEYQTGRFESHIAMFLA